MEKLIFSKISPTETDFQSKTINKIEIFPNSYSSWTFSIFLNSKTTIFITKDLTIVFHKNGESQFLFIRIFSWTTIHEYILFPWMSMNITKEHKSFLFSQLLNHLLCIEYSRMLILIRIQPLSIQIQSTETDSIITIKHSIYVQHRNDLEYELSPQLLSFLRRPCKEINYIFHYITGHSLTRMHSTSNHNWLLILLLNLLPILIIISNSQIITVIPSHRLTQSLPLHLSLLIIICFQTAQKLQQLTISIRIWMSQIDSIMFKRELHWKHQRIVITTWFPLHIVLIITNVITIPIPTHSFLFSQFHGIHQWLHPLIIKRIWLHHVYYIKSIFLVILCVPHWKVVPLSIPIGEIVWLQNQIVLKLWSKLITNNSYI